MRTLRLWVGWAGVTAGVMAGLMVGLMAVAMVGSCAEGGGGAAGYCGDGVVDTDLGEGCDDGNAVPGDGCSPTCISELGTELDCTNGIDDDLDGLIDCDDPGCATHPGCTGTTEIQCGDSLDNDGDGAIDCADSDCAADPLCQSAGELVCDNGLDDDSDGAVDCTDSDCDGQQCGANGLICQLGNCGCATGQTTEVLCTDGVDDDCDGLVDCFDPECAGAPACQGTENICDDGLDNDSDGSVDCLDADCGGAPCGANGQICSGGTCACPGGSNETQCTDSTDNDCDGAVDCADSDCALNPACQGTENICDDGQDNDSDGAIDCLDSDCTGQPCDGLGRVCASGVCNCPGGTSEILCADSTDNDCDGAVDCADSDCSGVSCGSNGLICSGGGCICPGGTIEVCANSIDDNCNGQIDENCGGSTCTDAHPDYNDCPAGENCIPQPNIGSDGICETPVGTGTQYSVCLSRADCAPGYTCVNGLTSTYCMQWCWIALNDCLDIWDTCVGLDPAVYLSTAQWGVCWDYLM